MLLYIHETFLRRNSLLCPEGIQEIFTSKGGILTVLQTDKGGGEDQEEESFFPFSFEIFSLWSKERCPAMAWWVISQDVFWTHQEKGCSDSQQEIIATASCTLSLGENPTEKITLLVGNVYFFNSSFAPNIILSIPSPEMCFKSQNVHFSTLTLLKVHYLLITSMCFSQQI